MSRPTNLPPNKPTAGRPDELHRIVRILRIIRAIAEQPGRWQRGELAAQHQVSERMITKDLALLRAIGLLIANDNKAPGYYFAGEVDAHLVEVASQARERCANAPTAEEAPDAD